MRITEAEKWVEDLKSLASSVSDKEDNKYINDRVELLEWLIDRARENG